MAGRASPKQRELGLRLAHKPALVIYRMKIPSHGVFADVPSAMGG
jgi:hypothetical protein